MDKVSVIIPTWNRQDTLLRAVNSALQQTFPVHEIIVCDDGSDDNSKKLIAELNNPKVKWLDCGRNGMPSVPRNMGIKNSTGHWIAFLDSDDEWLPEKIERQMGQLKKDDGFACSCNAYRIFENKNTGPYLSWKKTKISFSDLLPVNLNICSSVIVKKDMLEQISLFPEDKKFKAIEDYALWLRLSTAGDFSYVAEPLLNYYDSPASSVRANYTDVWALREVIFADLLEWIRNKNIEISPEDQRKATEFYELSLNKGKHSIWKRVKNKLKN